MNYQDDSGDWHPIDNTLVDAPGAAYAVENAANDVNVEIPADAGSTPVKVSDDDYWVTMKMHGLDGDPDVEDDTATFDDVAAGDSVEYQAVGSGVQETITLDQAPDPAQPLSYTYDLTASPGLSARISATNGVEFIDAAGAVRMVIPLGTLTDSATVPATVSAGQYSLTATAAGWQLGMTPNMTWLTDPSRTYPVFIDPDVDFPLARDCVLKSAAPNGNFCYNGNERGTVGYKTDTDSNYTSLLDFNFGSIPSTSTITSAVVNMTINQGGSSTNSNNYAIYTTSSTWTNDATWNSPFGGNSTWQGGSKRTPASNQQTVSRSTPSAAFDVKGIVIPFVQTPSTATGMVLSPVTSAVAHMVYYPPTDPNRPKLTVNYYGNAPGFLYVSPVCSHYGTSDGSISGYITNPNNAPATGTVTLLNSARQPINSTSASMWANGSMPFAFTGLGVDTYTLSADIGPPVYASGSMQSSVGQCPPTPYEPPAPVDNFQERDGQALPANPNQTDPSTAVVGSSATAQALPATSSASATVSNGTTWTSFGTTPVAVRGSQVTKAGQTVPAGAQASGDQVQMSMTRLNTGASGFGSNGTPTIQVGVTTTQDAEQPASTGPNDDLELKLNYASFVKSYGGNFADRLQVRAYPACFDTTPSDPACQVSTTVPMVNDTTGQTLVFAAAPPLKSGQSAPTPPTAAQMNNCFTTVSPADSTIWDEPSAGPAADSDSYATDTAPTSDSDGTFDDTGAANDPDGATPSIAQTAPAAATGQAPSPAELTATATQAASCRGLVYQVAAGAGVYAMAASGGDSSLTGAATLSPSAGWQVGDGTGDFRWSYPFALPKGMSNTVPQLALSYSSASVDGNNAQASAAGLGWTLDPGHISRTYAACSDDGASDTSGDLCWRTQPASASADNQPHLVDDLSLVLQGHSTRLIHDDASGGTGAWRLQDDPGWRVEHFNGSDGSAYTDPGTAPANADGDNEAFRVTSPDGTQYFFGYYPDANSVWTVPVRGNDANEPCNGQGIGSTACRQGWQWNLDKVVDSDGNRVRYTYATETNYYNSLNSTINLPYISAGRLASIQYGYSKAGSNTTDPQLTVTVDSVDRCNANFATTQHAIVSDPAGTNYCTGQNSATSSPNLWPDTPTDLICTASGSCANRSPAFFSQMRYSRVTTSRGRGSSAVVDRYILKYNMPPLPSGDTADDPSLWLYGIEHQGSTNATRDSTQDEVPDLSFDGTYEPNVVAAVGVKAFQRQRLSKIINELGGRTTVDYGFPTDSQGQLEQCDAAYVSGRQVWTSNRDCFAPRSLADDTSPTWMHKYLVMNVTLDDMALGLASVPDKNTSLGTVRKYVYQYVGDPGWRFDGSSRNVPFRYRSWSDWRGYELSRVKTMRVDKSAPGTPLTTAKSIRRVVVYRGMNNSRSNKSGNIISGRRICTVEHGSCQNNTGQPLDSNFLQGNIAEETILTGNDGTWVDRTYHGYKAYKTATNAVGLSAHFAQENITRTHTHILHACLSSETGCPTSTHVFSYDRRHAVDSTFQNGGSNHQGLYLGTVLTSTDRGADTSADTAGDDNVCTTNTYTGNPNTWLRVPIRTVVNDVAISGTTKTQCGNLRSQVDDFYEGTETQTGTALNNGHLTKVQTLTDAATGHLLTTHTAYDTYGRVIKTISGNGNITTTAYNDSATVDNLATTTVVTANPGAGDQRQTTTTLSGDRGLPTLVTDNDNQATTKMTYDGYGRVTAVTKPNLQAQGGSATSIQYEYKVNLQRPSKIKTTTRRDASNSDISFDYYDGWGRNIETQTPEAVGTTDPTTAHRLVSATAYDELGLPYIQIPAWANQYAPGSGLLNPNPDLAVRYTLTNYDAAGRVTQVTNKTNTTGTSPATVSVHDTTTIDQRGDGTTVHPARGGEIVTGLDGWGRITSVTQYADPDTNQNPLHAASYTYNGAGNLTGISSTIGNNPRSWAYTYDLTGRRLMTTDPDTGTSTSAYDDDNNQTSITTPADGKVQTLYDNQDRPTKRFKINASGQPNLSDCTGTSATDPNCTLLATWSYDTASRGDGKLTSTTSYNPYNQLGTYTKTISGYDRDGNVSGVTYTYPGDITGATPTGTTTMSQNWNYNDADLTTSTTYGAVANLPALTVTNGYTNNSLLSTETASDQTNLLTATYDKAGEPLRALSGSASDVDHHLNREYAWDNDTGRITRVGGSAFGTLDYTYDKIGNPLSITADNLWSNGYPTADPSTWCYSYDALLRISTVKTGAKSANNDCASPAADSGLIGANQNLSYTYAGDRLNVVTSVTGGASSTSTYRYNNGTPHQTAAILTTGNDPALPTGSTMAYDTAGRIKTLTPSSGPATTYTYNPTGSLKTSTTGSTASDYAYDVDGTRTGRRTAGNGAVLYLGDTEVTITGSTQSARRILTTPGGPPLATQLGTGSNASPGTPTWTFMLGDAQQSIRYTRDQATGNGTRPTYRPYGQAIYGPALGERGYLNQPTDPNGDLRLDQRNYQPTLNILTTPDLLLDTSDPQTLNPYAYSRNNPITLADPSGLRACDETVGLVCGNVSLPPSIQYPPPPGDIDDCVAYCISGGPSSSNVSAYTPAQEAAKRQYLNNCTSSFCLPYSSTGDDAADNCIANVYCPPTPAAPLTIRTIVLFGGIIVLTIANGAQGFADPLTDTAEGALLDASVDVAAGDTAAEGSIEIDQSINTRISAQRQARHVLDSDLYNGGGYFKDASEAQTVLDAYHSGDATILRTTPNGNVIVRYGEVTGFNNNLAKGYLDQPTDIFMIKGTSSVSVVPYSPGG